jgi:uncharacterized protein (DUF2147 family)
MAHMSMRLLPAAILAALSAAPAFAQTTPSVTGLWLDHTGRGAVEITNCGANLCGKLVWVKDAKNSKGCGIQILGDVKPVRGGKWDNGWIYDPDEDSRYDVEITPMGADKIKVLGYAGSKFLSETMIWKRAPEGLVRCDQKPATTAALTTPQSTETATPSTQAQPEQTPGSQVSTPEPQVKAEESPTATTETVTPAPAAKTEGRAPGTTAKKKKGCKMEFASIAITFPCD